jgi:para-aminobenzoate synthetase component 1
MHVYSHDLDYTEASAFFTAFAHEPYALLLDSADRAHPDARYSFIAVRPVETIESINGLITITNRAQQTRFQADPFSIVEQRLKDWNFSSAAIPELPPFQGGAAGFFGYDLTTQASGSLDMAIGLYDQVIGFDHHAQKAWIITHAENQNDATRKQSILLKSHPKKSTQDHDSLNWNSSITPAEFKTDVQKIIDYILAGDVFQANLSHRFSANLPKHFDPYDHYQTLRSVNPAPFAGFMNCGGLVISSASPERFLECHNHTIKTKPIKGTVPRTTSPDLLNNAKDRAENIMIVDLMRNDLSRVCEPDSIHVEKLCAVESFANVHHLVSTISGKLKSDETPLNALSACFPGGSITGAPKIRAMEIIAECEGTPRGPYCGSMGYVGANGSMDMNILIRTLVYNNDTVSFNVGGGITASSEPAAEYQETLDKAAGLFNSFITTTQARKRA